MEQPQLPRPAQPLVAVGLQPPVFLPPDLIDRLAEETVTCRVTSES